MSYKAPASSTSVTGNAIFDTKDVLVTNGLVQHKCGLQPGPHNLGITYAGGTLTVCSASTAALSATNPGYVTLQSKTAGKLVTIAVTANQTLTDGAAGTTDNQRFGLVTAVNWSNDIPFFIHAVLDDSETAISFMITRNPAATVSPAAASIGKTGAIVNVGQGDFFAMGDPAVADYEGNPCLCIGSFRAQFVGATDSWTISALASNDGIGRFNDSTPFSTPTGVNGSAAGTIIQSNAGTEPTFTTQSVIYRLLRTGICVFFITTLSCNNVPAGANAIAITLPYKCTLSAYSYVGRRYDASATETSAVFGQIISGNNYLDGIQIVTSSATVNNAHFANGDSININGSFFAF